MSILRVLWCKFYGQRAMVMCVLCLSFLYSYRHGTSLIDVMAAWLQIKDVRGLQNLHAQQYAELRSFLKGVRVKVVVAPGMKARPIADLVPRAALQEFDTETERLTVAVCKRI